MHHSPMWSAVTPAATDDCFSPIEKELNALVNKHAVHSSLRLLNRVFQIARSIANDPQQMSLEPLERAGYKFECKLSTALLNRPTYRELRADAVIKAQDKLIEIKNLLQPEIQCRINKAAAATPAYPTYSFGSY